MVTIAVTIIGNATTDYKVLKFSFLVCGLSDTRLLTRSDSLDTAPGRPGTGLRLSDGCNWTDPLEMPDHPRGSHTGSVREVAVTGGGTATVLYTAVQSCLWLAGDWGSAVIGGTVSPGEVAGRGVQCTACSVPGDSVVTTTSCGSQYCTALTT